MQQKKSQLRDAIKKRIAQMSEKDRAAESRSICRRILETLPDAPVMICAYNPITYEVDIRPLLEELLAKKYQLYLPRYEGGKNVFRKLEDLKDLTKGSFDILEPPRDAELLPGEGETIALVPSRAFDRMGGRLGRGNGGYDHWIAAQRSQNPQTQFWGICFDCQLVQEVPMEEHDERVDGVITGRGLFEV